jgi:hypothetical protein
MWQGLEDVGIRMDVMRQAYVAVASGECNGAWGLTLASLHVREMTRETRDRSEMVQVRPIHKETRGKWF